MTGHYVVEVIGDKLAVLGGPFDKEAEAQAWANRRRKSGPGVEVRVRKVWKVWK